MWTRKELKDKAKVSLKVNYWKTVLVTLIVLAIAGGAGGFNSTFSIPVAMTGSTMPTSSSTVHVSNDDVSVSVDGDKIHVDVKDDGSGHAGTSKSHGSTAQARSVDVSVGPAAVMFGITALLIGLMVAAIAIAFYAFIFNPALVGAQRFFLRNLNRPAEIKEIAYAYDNNYLETVKTIFMRDLFIFLWSLLLIVPGIIKSYEYRMIPYLMAEDPTLTRQRAFEESKRMMTGQKWNTFVLDLSFLGWYILSALTLGILAIFYVGPYQSLTNAALYEKLRYGMPAPQPQAYAPYGQPPAQPSQPWQQAQPWQQGQPVQPVQATQPMYQAHQPATTEIAPMTAAEETAPVIASSSQPPVPPFAAVGADVSNETGEASDTSEVSATDEAGATAEANATDEASATAEASATDEAGEANETDTPEEGENDSPQE